MTKLKQIITTMLIMLGVLLVPLSATANAVNVFGGCPQTGNTAGTICGSQGDSAKTLIGNIVNILIYIAGAIAVIVIIVGGIKYVTSGGDSSQMSNAKNTILYAVIGLVVVVMAYGIVQFVLANIK